MGTRCNIVLKCGNHMEYIYRHYDGYPSSVVPELNKLLALIKWYTKDSYRFNKQTTMLEFYRDLLINHTYYDKFFEDLINPMQLTGKYEKTNGIHGDVEHVYTININSLDQTGNYVAVDNVNTKEVA